MIVLGKKTKLKVTQSKSKTQITRSVYCKFNCITVKYNGTQHGIYIILEVHYKFIIQIHFNFWILETRN